MELTAGQITQGKITGITNFGVFVDLGEGKSGMVHISEVARSYVNDINEHVKIGDEVKVKVLGISEDGKISLSIKRALEPERPQGGRERKDRKVAPPPKPDGSYTWMPRKQEPQSFEEMMNRFKQTSDEKFSEIKRKNPDAKRTRRPR